MEIRLSHKRYISTARLPKLNLKYLSRPNLSAAINGTLGYSFDIVRDEWTEFIHVADDDPRKETVLHSPEAGEP